MLLAVGPSQLATAWIPLGMTRTGDRSRSRSRSPPRRRSRSPPSSSVISAPPSRRSRSPPRRFAKYDRVWCALGGEVGWASGNVQAVDEPAPDEPSFLLPYVVMLDPPLKRLISVPADRNSCVRPDLCFEAWPDAPKEAWAQPCVKAANYKPPLKRLKLRFAVGDRVACLTGGPDGLDWPRRWSAGTISRNVAPPGRRRKWLCGSVFRGT